MPGVVGYTVLRSSLGSSGSDRARDSITSSTGTAASAAVAARRPPHRTTASAATAAAPSDYTAASGSITFQTTDTTKTIQVQSVTDGVVDSASNETFFVNLTTNAGTNGATLADSQGQGLIADVDASVPSVPQNMRSNPNIQSNPGGNYSVLWNASTGPVSSSNAATEPRKSRALASPLEPMGPSSGRRKKAP